MSNATEPLVKIQPLGGDQVSITAIGTRNAIREVLGAPDSTMDLISDLVATLEYVLKNDRLTTGSELLVAEALKKAGRE